jgi:hypothetical protein
LRSSDGLDYHLPISYFKETRPDRFNWNSIIGSTIEIFPVASSEDQADVFFPHGAQVGLAIVGPQTIQFELTSSVTPEGEVFVTPSLTYIKDESFVCELQQDFEFLFADFGELNNISISFEWFNETNTIQFRINEIDVCTDSVPYFDVPSDVMLYADATEVNVDILIKSIFLTTIKEK